MMSSLQLLHTTFPEALTVPLHPGRTLINGIYNLNCACIFSLRDFIKWVSLFASNVLTFVSC